MTDTRCRELAEIGDRLFNNRGSLMSLWQDIAENFHPERADFTLNRVLGDDFCSHLMTGYPALQVRDLADQLSAMLRPRSRLWAKLTATNQRVNTDTQARTWLEWASERQRKATYSSRSQFLRCTKTADLDFVSFGQAVILPTLNDDQTGLLFRCFHLRDTVWAEDANQQINFVARKEKLTARDIIRYFPKTHNDKHQKANEKEPFREFECRHVVVPAEMYSGKTAKNKDKFPYYSIYLDKENDSILEEVPQKRVGYVIPRWRLGAFNQYATSPCTMLALPDGRLLQQMAMSLLEAGEKAANPPIVATQEAVRTDIQLFAGGVTWVDQAYDERLGDALRPLNQDFRGLNTGLKMLEDVRAIMKEVFFLNKINLPEVTGEMTAYETRKRIEEYVRAALPLFEPMEIEYNGALSNEVFAILMDNNAFGPPDTMPPVLRGQDVHFEFESPLQATAERLKSQSFQEAAQMTQIAAQLDPSVTAMLNVKQAYPDALRGVDVPANWIFDMKQAEALIKAKQKAMADQMQMQQMGQAADMAKKAAPMVAALQQKGQG